MKIKIGVNYILLEKLSAIENHNVDIIERSDSFDGDQTIHIFIYQNKTD